MPSLARKVVPFSALLALLALAGCGPQMLDSAEAQLHQRRLSSPVPRLSWSAEAYVLRHGHELATEQPIRVDGVEIPAGTDYGQTMRPRIDQLREMGEMHTDEAGANIGSIRLAFEPAGCGATLPAGCQVVATVRAGYDQDVVRIDVSPKTAALENEARASIALLEKEQAKVEMLTLR